MAKHMVLTYLQFRIHMVGGWEHLDYFSHHIGNVIIPTVTHSIIFQGDRAPPPTRYIIQPDISYHKSAINPIKPTFPYGFLWLSFIQLLGILHWWNLFFDLKKSSQVMVNTSMWPCSLPASERPLWWTDLCNKARVDGCLFMEETSISWGLKWLKSEVWICFHGI